MFKWTKLSTVLVLILVGLFTIAAYKPTLFQGGLKITPLRDGTQPQLLIIEDGSGTTLFKISNQGQINNQNIVMIDNIDDLSAWADTTGASYFQMEWGKTYIVDPHAIATSNDGSPAGATVFANEWASSVSAILPLATATSHKESVTVTWATTGDFAGGSGVTAVGVWSAPYAGVTAYGHLSGQIQNMTGMATSGSSVITVMSGTSSQNINSYGDTETWQMFNESAVSATLSNKYMP